MIIVTLPGQGICVGQLGCTHTATQLRQRWSMGGDQKLSESIVV